MKTVCKQLLVCSLWLSCFNSDDFGLAHCGGVQASATKEGGTVSQPSGSAGGGGAGGDGVNSAQPVERDCKRVNIELGYANLRASNAEAELEAFKVTHETSMRTCVSASEKQSSELDKCRMQTKDLVVRFNDTQEEKLTLQKELSEAKAQLSHADRKANDTCKGGESASVVEERKKKLEESQTREKEALVAVQKCQTELKGVTNKLGKTLESLASAEHKKEATDSKLETCKEQMKKTKEGHTKHSADSSSPSSDSQQQHHHHLFSYEMLQMGLGSACTFYRAVGTYLSSFVVDDLWNGYERLSSEAAKYTSPYTSKVKPHVTDAAAFVHRHYLHSMEFYDAHMKATVDSQAAKAGDLLSHYGFTALSYLEGLNEQMDQALKPFFAAHPETRVLIPSGLLDRIVCLIFLIFVLYAGLRIAMWVGRTAVCPVLCCLVPSFCKRRSDKIALKTKSTTSKSGKKFVPATQTSLKKPKDSSVTSTTTKVASGNGEGVPTTLKKHKA